MATNIESVCIIQARMDSQRLPNKALALLGGTPIIEWVIRRVQQSRRLTKIVLATTTNQSDDVLAEFGANLGVEVFRGSQDDVLGRFSQVLASFNAEVVIRVCADNPFVSGTEIDLLLASFELSPADYLFNHRPVRECNYADGFGAELIRSSVLLELNKSVVDKQMREHITLALEARGIESSRGIEALPDMRFPYLRFDVDTQADLDQLSELVEKSTLSIGSTPEEIIRAKIALAMQNKLESLFPLNRSLTGQGNRETLSGLSDLVDLDIIEIATGTQVYDWEVPQEWELRNAYIEDSTGCRIVDSAQNPLHVVSYSQACNEFLSFDELEPKVHQHPSLPMALPYRTSYYKQDWGFCVTHQQAIQLKSAQPPLHVVIDSKRKDGSLTCAELIIKGRSDSEVLVSSYICHPAMANDSLSGVILSAFLARHISSKNDLKFTYRFVFVPETIGAIAYLHLNQEKMKQIDFGFQITTVGGPGKFQVKKSFETHHPVNSLVEDVLRRSDQSFESFEFDIHGSDERQYSSPGFRINMVTLAKDIYYSYPQYHTSLDNLDYVSGSQIAETFHLYTQIIDEIEQRRVFIRIEPHGEPMLSRHGLIGYFGGSFQLGSTIDDSDLLLWIMFLSDGQMSTFDIAKRIGVLPSEVLDTCEMLVGLKLLEEI